MAECTAIKEQQMSSYGPNRVIDNAEEQIRNAVITILNEQVKLNETPYAMVPYARMLSGSLRRTTQREAGYRAIREFDSARANGI
jgi:hypothetical protein